MNQLIFNAAMLVGLVMIMLGVGLAWSFAAALVVGGALIMGVTLKLAFRVGVNPNPTKD